MIVDEVLKHFGGIAETAQQLGVTYQAVHQWVEKGEVPEGRQYQIQLLTAGALLAKPKQKTEAA